MPRTRPRQARLAFTPLPSSSPASKGYNRQIQDRAASVAIAGSPGSSKSQNKHQTHNEREHAVLTPEPSANDLHDSDDEDEDEDNITVTNRDNQQPSFSQPSSFSRSPSRRQAAKQQRLNFTRARDPSSFDPAVTLPSSSIALSSSAGVFGDKGKRARSAASDSSDEDDLPLPLPITSSARRTRGATKILAEASDSESGREIAIGNGQRPQIIDVGSEEQDEDEDADDMPTTLGTQRRRLKRKRAPSVDSFLASSPPAVKSDDDLEIIEPPSRKRRRGPEDDDVEQDEDGDMAPVTPRRRLKRRRQVTAQEEEDLAEDLDFLQPSSDVESARKPRSSQSARKTAHQKALQKLRMQRSGKPAESEEDEDEDDSAEKSNDDSAGVDDGDDDDEDGDDIDTHAPMSSRQMFAADEDDDNFIEQEDDNILGVPDGVPLKFTRYASMKGKDLFKFAVEWMVQKKINPAFAMNDEIYELTFQKLADELTGLAGSKFISSIWRPEFTLALRARPGIFAEPIDRNEPEHLFRDHCDACNRSGHPATYLMQFHGKPYHPTTLDEVNEADRDDNDDEDDNTEASTSSGSRRTSEPTYDHQGREIPSSDHKFFVGKFCKANAETAHALHHWRVHLYDMVEAYLITQKYMTAEKIGERDRWSTRRKRKYANKIVDQMALEGAVKDLWRNFRGSIDHARDMTTYRRY